MSYITNKKMVLFGIEYQKGTQVPDKVFVDIPQHRQDSLLRTRLILEVEAPPVQGDMCSVCGEGPFSRLAQHLSLKHPEGMEILDALDSHSEEE